MIEKQTPFIPVAKPWLGEEEAAAAGRAILSGWVTQGKEVAGFEQEFAAFTGSLFACAVSSCTTALNLALLAIGVGPGDEVITASHSFIATANSIRYCGAKPVFCDIDPATFNMSPDLIESLITPRTKAILCVHQMGMPCDLKRIVPLARKHHLAVVEDAACAIGSEVNLDGPWQQIGQPHGDIACFSFHPRKLVTTGDGGMLTTANPDWNKQFRLLRQHGMSVPDSVRHSSKTVVFEDYVSLGYNFRMTDIQAAVGREQLRRLPDVINRRRELATRYNNLLGDLPGVTLPSEPDWARSNWQSYCVRLPDQADQRIVMQSMLNDGVAARRGVMCAHREPAYPHSVWSCGEDPKSCGCLNGGCKKLTQSEKAQDHGLILPLFHQLTLEDQDRVVMSLKKALRGF